MDRKKIWRSAMDAMTILGVIGLFTDLARLWSWLVDVWEFFDARLWLKLSIFLVSLAVGQWLRRRIRKEEVERKAKEAEEASKRQQAEEASAKAKAKREALEKVYRAADGILIVLQQAWDSWDETSDETWEGLETLTRDMRNAALELPVWQSEPWHNYALELYLICKSASGFFSDADHTERRDEIRRHCSHLSGIIRLQLPKSRQRVADP